MADSTDPRLTLKNVAPMISGMIFVPDPAGSYAIDPDRHVFLDEVLLHALKVCGLEDRIQEVYDAAWAYAAPHFQAEVDRLEAVRKAMAGPE